MAVQVTITQPSAEARIVIDGRTVTSPFMVLQGLKEQRSELRNQLDRFEDRRQDLKQELTESPSNSVDRKGLEQRLIETDVRISELEKEITVVDAAVAKATAVPGAVLPPRPPIPRQGPPEEAYALAGMFMVVVLLPLTIAYARRLWRRGAAVVSAMPAELADRLTRIEQAVDAIAVEVERVGEGQRYVTHLFAEGTGPRALGAGAAEPVELHARQAELHRR